jgi:hypothetical protein
MEMRGGKGKYEGTRMSYPMFGLRKRVMKRGGDWEMKVPFPSEFVPTGWVGYGLEM